MASNDLMQLVKAGFVKSCDWQKNENGEIVSVHKNLPNEPGIYAFVVDGEVMYIGSANGLAKKTTLRSRMRSYQRHQRKDSKDRPVHSEIKKIHEGNKEIEIYTFAPDLTKPVKWGNLPIDLLIGLEAGLIKQLNPKWNRRGRNPVLDEVLEK